MKIISSLLIISLLLISGCAESLVDSKMNQGRYDGPYQVGRSAHHTAYADQIAPALNPFVTVHGDLFVSGDVYVNGRVIERDLGDRFSMYTRTIDDINNPGMNWIYCAPALENTDSKSVIKCDVSVTIKKDAISGVSSSSSATSSGTITFAADPQNSQSWTATCPFADGDCSGGGTFNISIANTMNGQCIVNYENAKLTVTEKEFKGVDPTYYHCSMSVTETIFDSSLPAGGLSSSMTPYGGVLSS